MANDLTFTQLSTVLNAIVSQATGAASQAVVDTSTFVNVAQTALKTGYDPLATAISQVLSRTIFSTRPYSAKFPMLRKTAQQYGNHTRKLQVVDKDFENDQRFSLTEGASIDMYAVNKPKVLQTNFYGSNIWQKHITIYRDQLDNAFSGPDEFAAFLSMYIQNASDMIEQAHESTLRMTIANFIAAKSLSDADNCVNLLEEYNAHLGLDGTTGKEYKTINDIRQPDEYIAFTRWMFARINTYSDWLTERTVTYHLNITDNEISRHTPKNMQRLIIYAPEMNNIDASVLSNLYNTNYMNIGNYEKVNFWQSIKSPDSINVTPSYVNTSGAVQKGSAVTMSNIVGVLFDDEAMGMTTVNEWSSATPFNSAGGYYNQYYHFTDKYWNDTTENAIVFYLKDLE